MAEWLVPEDKIAEGIFSYGQILGSFARTNRLPANLLAMPDHVMYKTATPGDFETIAREAIFKSSSSTFAEIDGRFLLASRLLVPKIITVQSVVRWVEVMEAKSPEGTADYIGLEYGSFFYPSFGIAERLMKKTGVNFQSREDGMNRWIQVPINECGQELRITDTYLEQTVDRTVQDGLARII